MTLEKLQKINYKFTPDAKENILEMQNNNKMKLYTQEEIRQPQVIEANRRNPIQQRLERKSMAPSPNQKRDLHLRKFTPPTALDKAKTPTPPKNTPVWADSVFESEVAVRELNVNQQISPSLLPEMTLAEFGSECSARNNL